MKKGFTLLELLIVVVILSILALIAAPALLNAVNDAKNAAVGANVNAAASSITSRFALNNDEKPSDTVTAVLDKLSTNKDPIDSTKAAFVSGSAGEAGQVALQSDDTNSQIVIHGFDRKGNEFLTKTVAAPADNN